MKNFKELAESKQEVYELGAVVSKLQEFTTRYLFCVNRVIPLLMSKEALDEHERSVLTGFVMSLHSDIFPMLTGMAKYVDPYCAELLIEAASTGKEETGAGKAEETKAEADFNRAASCGFVYRPPAKEKADKSSKRKASTAGAKKKGTETGYTRGKTKGATKEGEADNAKGRKGRRRKGDDDPGN